MSERKPHRRLPVLLFIVVAGLHSCSSTPREEPEAPREEIRQPARPRFEGRRSQIAPLPEFRNTAAAAPASEPAKAESPPFWAQLARLNRDSTPFALLFGGLIWLMISLLSIFYRYQHARDGLIARSLVAFVIAVPFTLFWITASVFALGVLAVMALTLAGAAFAGWRRERRWRRERAPDPASAAPEIPAAAPGLTRSAPDEAVSPRLRTRIPRRPSKPSI